MCRISPTIIGLLLGVLLMFMGVGQVEAAQSIPISVGTPITLGVETELLSPSYSWVLEQGGQLTTAQSERFFRHTFEAAGIYDLSLTLRGADAIIETHSFILQVEPSITLASSEAALRAVIRSMPSTDKAGRVRLPADGGVLQLYFDESSGDIAEYRVDANVELDTNGNGIPNDDADNALHSSFSDGGSFVMSLHASAQETERRMQLSVVDRQGNVSNADLIILFDPTLALTPNLKVFPAGGDDSIIRIGESGGVVRFDATGSYGGAVQYALDLDLEYDSSGDGIPGNDNDAAGTLFEQRGFDLTFFLKPRSEKMQRSILLAVANPAGEIRTLERTVIFGAEISGGPSQVSLPSAGQIVSDQETLEVGRKFTLTAEEIPVGTSKYAWDLQNDGLVDTQTSGPSILLAPDTPGVFPVRLIFIGSDGNALGSATKEWTVNPIGGQIPSRGAEGFRIDIVSEGLIARFALVTDDLEHLDLLEPTWEFGDGATSYLLEPEHSYAESGSYDVRVTLRSGETGDVMAETSSKAIVSGTPVLQDKEGEQEGVLTSILRSVFFIFKVMIFVLITLIIITDGVFFFLYMQAQKAHVPVPEMVKRYKEKFTGKIPDPLAEITDPKKAEVIDAKETEPVKGNEPAPMKLQAEEVKESSPVVEPPSTPEAPPVPEVSSTPSPTSPNKEEEALPPWLSGEAPKSDVPVTPPTPPEASPHTPLASPTTTSTAPATPPHTPAPPAALPSAMPSEKSVVDKPSLPPATPPVTTPQPPSTELPTPVVPPSPSDPKAPSWLKGGLEKSEENIASSDDETIAIIKADDILPAEGQESGTGILPVEGNGKKENEESKEIKENKEGSQDMTDETSHNVS